MEQRLCAVCGADISHRKEQALFCGEACSRTRRNAKKLLKYYANHEENKRITRVWHSKNRERSVENNRRFLARNPEWCLHRSAKVRAEKRGIAFELKVEDIVIPPVCPVTKRPLVRGKGRQGPDSPSLDRIDPRRGYVKGNIRVISYAANARKSDMRAKEAWDTYVDIVNQDQAQSACDYCI